MKRFLILFLLLPQLLLSQEYLFDIQHFSLKDGLPNRQIIDLKQDLDGNIWGNGIGFLFRFDGYTFETFKAKDLEVENNIQLQFDIGQKGLIWYSGMSLDTTTISTKILNPLTKKVRTLEQVLKTKGHHTLKEINRTMPLNAVDEMGLFLYAFNGDIYNYQDDELNLVITSDKRYTRPRNFSKTSEGYWFLSIGTDTLFHLLPNGNLDFKIASDKIVDLRVFQDTVYVAHSSNPNEEGRSWYKLQKETFVPVEFPSEFWNKHGAKDFVVDSQGFKWIVVKEGKDLLACISPDGKIIFNQTLTAEAQEVGIRRIFLDEQENLWISSSNGLFKITYRPVHFKKYLKNKAIRGIVKHNKQLLISHTSGISALDLDSEELYDSFKNVGNTAFLKENNMLWAGTYFTYLTQINLLTGDTKNISHHHASDRRLQLPYRSKKSTRLWIGSTEGLSYLEAESDSIQFFESKSEALNMASIRQAYENEQGLWLATSKGIFLTNDEGHILQVFDRASGFPTEDFNYLYIDKTGIFWIASKDEGLIRWNAETNEQKVFGLAQGFFNETIYGVYEDDFGFLWLPSDYGLIRFNKETEGINTYLPEHGIPHEEFNTWAHYQDTTTGKLYFGGLGGLVAFHPKDLIQNTEANVPLNLKSFRVLPNDEAEMLDRTEEAKMDKRLIIRPSDKLFELQFSLMDFKNNKERRYAYKIEGYEENWNYITSNSIRINSIPYGNYKIIIKGQVDGITWSDNQLILDLVVLRPFYLQWWFLVLAIGSLLGGIILFFKYRTYKLRQDKEQLENIVQLRTAKIKEQTEALKQLDVAKTNFFSNITHEFRTPLTLILGPAKQLHNEEKQAKKQKRLFSIIKNANHLLSLINQLLDLSKLESGQNHIELKHGDIVAYTQGLVHLFEPLAKRKKQKLLFFTNTKAWETNFDQEKWNKVIFNLLSNAIKFTPENGRIELHLTSVNDKEQEMIYLKVKDNGKGIEANNLSQVFNRFYQVDASSTRIQEGAGIGLSLVKELIEIQGGDIQVDSEIGKGTTFEIKIPILESKKELPAIKKHEFENSPLLLESFAVPITTNLILKEGQLEVLIIEDNADMRHYIQSCLEDSQYHITMASDGVEGIEKAFETIPDLIISDVMMPKKDGFEVVTSIRNNLPTSHIPIVLLTAKAALESRLEGLARGADAYLTKPFSPDELIIRVQKLIEVRQMLQQRYQTGIANYKSDNEIYQREDAFITEFRTYIKTNLEHPDLTVEKLGKQFFMSRVHLYRKIKALTNNSVSTFIRKVRLEEAKELLKNPNLTISEVSHRTGFSSLSYFSRVFKEEYGSTPSEMK